MAKFRKIFKYWPISGLVIVLIMYSVLLGYYFAPAITHPDAHGYWAQGSLLMDTGHTWFKPESDAQYIGMHWLVTPDGKYLSRYPPGFPVLVGIIWKLFGWQASLLINPVLGCLSLIGIFLIVRRLTTDCWALFAMTALAVNPTFITHSLTNISHMPVAFCLIWGFFLLQLWSEKGLKRYVFIAGLVLGCIPSIRYPDSVVALGVAAFLLMHWRKFPRIYWHYLVAVSGALIPVIPLLVRNQLLLGAFWRTGYSLTNEQTGFGWDYFCKNSMGYLQTLGNTGLGVFFILGMVGIIWMICEREKRQTGLFLLLTTMPLLILYMSYYWSGGMNRQGPGGGAGAMRFFVPFIPMYVIAATWMLFRSLKAAPLAAKIAVPVVIILVQALIFYPNAQQSLRREYEKKHALVLATKELEEVTQKGDVIVAQRALQPQLDFIRKWKQGDSKVMFSGRMGFGRGGRERKDDPDRPSPRQSEKSTVQAKNYQGSQYDNTMKFLDDLEAWAGKKAIYVIGTKEELPRLLPGVSPVNNLTIIKRIKMPQPTQTETPRNNRRGGRNTANRRGGGPGFDRRRPKGGGRQGLNTGEDIIIARWD